MMRKSQAFSIPVKDCGSVKEEEKDLRGDIISQIGDDFFLSHSISQPLSDGLDHGLHLLIVEHGFILAEG